MYFLSTNSYYEGYFQDNMFHGKGKLVTPTFIYEGEWKENKKHGKGFYDYLNGTTYYGVYKENLREGDGKLIKTNG